MKKSSIVALFPMAVLLLSGCKPDAAVKQGEIVGAGPSVSTTAVSPAELGSVTGTVKIMGKVPKPVKIDMSQDPACALSKEPNLTEQIVAADGKLSNVFVYVRNAPAVQVSQKTQQPVTVDQKNCRFTPHVSAVMQGGAVLFTNSDLTMHNVHTMAVEAGNRTVDVSEGPGMHVDPVKFATAETMVPLRCNNHPWMSAFINVSPTPFFAITGPSGKFQITGLPQGSYTLVFVHEKLGEQTMPITVKPQQATEASAVFNLK